MRPYLMHIMSFVQSIRTTLPAQAGSVPPPGPARPGVATHVRFILRILLAVLRS